MNLADIPTPALILDRGKLLANTQAMAARAQRAGIALRPHMKTAKSAEVARIATQGHSGGITVSTLAEASYFAAHGFTDITYAVCAVADKLDRAAALIRDGVKLKLLTDDAASAAALAERAAELNVQLDMLIELDSGEHRTGIACDDDRLLDIAAAIRDSPHLRLVGVLTHAGHSYSARSIERVQQVAEQERACVVNAAERLRAAGHECAVVSAGSTPTAVHAQSFEGLSEIRPGVYMFFDLAQVGRQSCTVGQVAVSVLATVISHRPEHNRLLIDAGGLALSKDVSANDFASNTGYGWVFDVQGQERIGDLHVATADQEHGFVEGSSIPFDKLPIGSRVRVLPNHACMTAAAYTHYYVVEGDDRVVDTWSRTGGW